MAVTRINNNQISSASAGNVLLGINANTKLQNFSITSNKIANNLTYGSDLTVAGNLTVQGNTTSIDTTITTIEDPVIVLASTQTGAPAVDIGFLGERGTANNIAFVWNEANAEFVTAFTDTSETNTTISILAYANLHTNNMVVGGTTSLIGNVLGATNFLGNVTVGNLSTAGNVTAAYFIGNISGNIDAAGSNTQVQFNDTGDILGASTGFTFDKTANLLTVAGNVSSGNVLTGGLVSATGNVDAGNVNATANVTGGNLVSATVTNTTAMTISTNAGNINLQPTGNVVLNDKYINGLQLTPVQDADAASKYYVDTIATTGITIHEAVFAATISNLATATGGAITYNQPNGAANGVGATLTTTGSYTVIDTANVQTVGTRILVKDQGNAVQNGVYVYSNATVITRSLDTDQYGSDAANAFSINDYFFTTSGNVNAGTAFVVNEPPGEITFGTSNIGFGIFSQSQVYSANTSAGLILNGTVFSAKVDNNTTAFDGTGNISVKASANLTTPNIGDATGTSLSVTGTVTAASTVGGVITGSSASLTGNVDAGNVNATANVTGGNVLTGGQVSATANITGGNIATAGILQGGNIVISGDDITDTNGRVNFNTAGADVDFAVNGDTVANIFYVDAVTGTASFGNATQTTNVLVAYNTSTSIKLPVGNTFQRPATGVTGMQRFNTTTNALEIYNNSEWQSVGATEFTVIADEQFNGDGSTVAFTLSSTQTTNSCIVSINGVVQIPTLAYAVSGTDPTCVLTFTEAPAASDVIDVRQITTTTTVLSISNTSGNARVAVDDTSATVGITGDLTVSGNATVLGNVGTNLILNGTSRIEIPDANGNIHFDINSANDVLNIGQFNCVFNSNVSATGNVTGSYILGNGSQLTGIDATSIQSGNSNVRVVSSGGNVATGVGGTSNVIVVATTGAFVTGVVSATGNISTDSNIVIGSGNSQIFNSTVNLEIVNNVSTGNINFRANVNGAGDSNVFRVLGTGGVGVVGNLISLSSNGAVANGASNIGSASGTFNTIFAKATSAQYADLAEKYTADAAYAPGTVVVFGGTAEVTANAVEGDTKVAGVVSTNPSYIMNSGLTGEHVATVALTGRVPTMVIGTVRKGDLMVAAGLGRAQSSADPKVGSVIGKALEDFDGAEGVIEVVVGRF